MLVLILVSADGNAQTSSTAEGRSQELEEIVVTARRREENVQHVPISMTAFTSKKIESLAARKMDQLPIPNLYLGEPDTIAFPQVSIRGIFSVQFSGGFDPAFGVYLDGVYVGRPQAVVNMDLAEVASYEVLRGPQGTLFGRNTIAGALNVTTKPPSNEFSGHANIQLGNYDLRRVTGSLNVPIVDGVLSARLSAQSSRRDGYVDFVGNDTCFDCGGNIETDGARFQMLLTPNEKLSLRLIADYLDDPRISYTFENIDESAGGDSLDFTVHGDLSTDSRKNQGISLTGEYLFDNGYALTSITAWRDDESVQMSDLDYTVQNNFFAENLFVAQKQFTQEFRLASPSGNWYEFVAGLYWFDQTVKEGSSIPVAFGFDFFSNGRTQTESYAVFGQSDFHVTDTTTVFAGVRFTSDSRNATFTQVGTAIVPFELLEGFEDELDSSEPSWTVGIRRHFGDNMMGYGSVSRGFKAGGFDTNLFLAADRAGNVTVRPELITSYEVGVKTDLLGDRLRLNGALFYMDYQDVQVLSRSFNPLIPGVQETRLKNAAKVVSKGLELELAAVLTENLTFSSAIGYTDAKFERYPGVTVVDGIIIDGDGNEIPFSPDWTVHAALDYEHPLTSGRSVFAHVDGNYISERYDSEDLGRNQPHRLMSGYSTLNGYVGYGPANDRWRISLWGRNLTDKRGLVKKADFGGITARHYIEPRTYGLMLTASFE